MAKKLFTLFTLALLTIPLGWAASEYIQLDASSFGLTGSYATKEVNVSGVGFKIDKGLKNSSNIQMNTNTKGAPGQLYNTSPITGLKAIRINKAGTDGSCVVTTGTTQKPTSNASQSITANGITTITVNPGDTYFMIQVSGATYFSAISIEYEPSSTPTPVATPTFSPDGGTYSSAQSVSISCATSGASIYYTMDGSTPTTPSFDQSTRPSPSVSSSLPPLSESEMEKQIRTAISPVFQRVMGSLRDSTWNRNTQEIYNNRSLSLLQQCGSQVRTLQFSLSKHYYIDERTFYQQYAHVLTSLSNDLYDQMLKNGK